MELLRNLRGIIIGLLLVAVPSAFSAGAWNGAAATAWNGIAATSWNGTGVSFGAGGGAYDPASDSTVIQWFKADGVVYNTGTTQATDGQTVETWVANDGKNATASAGAEPLFQTAVKNGLPAVEFAGTDEFMSTAAFDAAVSQPFAIAVVASYTGGTSDSRCLVCSTTARTAITHLGASNLIGVYADTGADYQTIGTDGAGWHIYILTYNAASSSFMVDGGTDTTTAASPGTAGYSGGLNLGRLEVSAQFWSGFIGEVIIFNAVPDATAKSAIRSYLNTKWAVY